MTPPDGSVYVFINARRDRVRLLHMEPGGLVLYMKILERGEPHVPERMSRSGAGAIEWCELVVMTEGMIPMRNVAVAASEERHDRLVRVK